MSDYDIAQLRGQDFGFGIVLSICLAKICELMPEPDAFLHAVQSAAIPRIDKEPLDFLQPSHRQTFVDAAIATVGQIAEAARLLRLHSTTPKLDA